MDMFHPMSNKTRETRKHKAAIDLGSFYVQFRMLLPNQISAKQQKEEL